MKKNKRQEKRNPEKAKLQGLNWSRNWRKKHPEFRRKENARRRQELGYFELWGSPFPEEIKVEYHHINDLLVIPLPDITHQKTLGKGKDHRKMCDAWIERIYCIDVDIFRGENDNSPNGL